MGEFIQKIQSDFALTIMSLKVKSMIPSYISLEVIKFLLKKFSRIFYILRDILTRMLKWDTLYILEE